MCRKSGSRVVETAITPQHHVASDRKTWCEAQSTVEQVSLQEGRIHRYGYFMALLALQAIPSTLPPNQFLQFFTCFIGNVRIVVFLSVPQKIFLK
jgi:hypothetical protein